MREPLLPLLLSGVVGEVVVVEVVVGACVGGPVEGTGTGVSVALSSPHHQSEQRFPL